MAKKPPGPPKTISLSAATHAGTHSSGHLAVRDSFADFKKLGAHLTRHRGQDDPKKPKAIIGHDVLKPPGLEALVTNAKHGGLTGIVPSASKLAVIDIDRGGDDAKQAVIRILGKPLLALPSNQPGRWHLYYNCPDAADLRKYQWTIGDNGGGDIIVGKNAVVLWHPGEVLDMLSDPPTGSPAHVSLDVLPRAGKREKMAKGNRNNALNARAYSAGQQGNVIDLEAAKLDATAAGLAPQERDDVANRAFNAGEADAEATPILSSDKPGLERALRTLDIDLCFDVRALRDEIKRGDGAWQLLTDREEADLWEEIALTFHCFTPSGEHVRPWRLSSSRMRLALNAVLKHREIDRFRDDFLEGLPAWDGTERVDNWLSDLFTDHDSPQDDLIKWAARFPFLGAVWRAYHPGKKMDEVPVLVGPQGIGKSTALRLMLPPDKPEWFTDGLNLGRTHKELAEATQGRVIIEASEMAGLSEAKIEKLKNYIATTDDGSVRLSYRRNAEAMPRRFVIVATTNDSESLPNDPSGNRRFVPIPLTGGNAATVARFMNDQRKQLWAEAKALFKKGVPAYLPDALKPAQRERAEAHRPSDDVIEDPLAGLAKRYPYGATMPQVLQHVGVIGHLVDAGKITVGEQRRVGKALRNMKFEKQRLQVDGVRQVLWILSDSP